MMFTLTCMTAAALLLPTALPPLLTPPATTHPSRSRVMEPGARPLQLNCAAITSSSYTSPDVVQFDGVCTAPSSKLQPSSLPSRSL